MGPLYPRFQLHASVYLGIIFLFIHLVAIFCVYFLPFILIIKALLVLAALGSLIGVVRNHIWYNNSRSIVEFGLSGDNDWYLKKRSGEIILVVLKPPIFISDYLIIINFVMKKRWLTIPVLIAKDGLNAKDFRKLKVLLKTMRWHDNRLLHNP